MASPDFSQYVDLTTFDVQPDSLYTDAIEYAQTALPEFNPRPGTIEDAILQAGAYIGAITNGAVNRLPDGLMEGILRLMGVTRNESTAGSIEVEFELFSAGDTVEAGTVFIFNYFDGSQSLEYPFVLNSAATADVGSTTVTATLTSVILGILPSIPIGSQFLPSSPSSSIFECTTTSEVAQGNISETDSEFFNRAVTYLQSLNATLCTATQVENYIIQTYSSVKRCKVYDLVRATSFTASSSNSKHSGTSASVTVNTAFSSSASAQPGTIYRIITPEFYGDATYSSTFASGTFDTIDNGLSLNPSANLLTYTDVVSSTASAGPLVDVVMLDSLLSSYVSSSANYEPGHFVVFVCGEDGLPIGRDVRLEIEQDLAERITAGLDFRVLDAWSYDLEFTITIGTASGFNSTTVANNLKDEIESFVSPNEWPNFLDRVRIYDIVGKALSVPGVEYVSSITSDIPSYPNSLNGNEKLVQEIVSGTTVTSYSSTYIGMLPRATVEIVTI